jgi:hypothetical protein
MLSLYWAAQLSQFSSVCIGFYLDKPIIAVPAMFVMFVNLVFKDFF